MKYLIFKSVRGIARPWIVVPPGKRKSPTDDLWGKGFYTWKEAIQYILLEESLL